MGKWKIFARRTFTGHGPLANSTSSIGSHRRIRDLQIIYESSAPVKYTGTRTYPPHPLSLLQPIDVSSSGSSEVRRGVLNTISRESSSGIISCGNGIGESGCSHLVGSSEIGIENGIVGGGIELDISCCRIYGNIVWVEGTENHRQIVYSQGVKG